MKSTEAAFKKGIGVGYNKCKRDMANKKKAAPKKSAGTAKRKPAAKPAAGKAVVKRKTTARPAARKTTRSPAKRRRTA